MKYLLVLLVVVVAVNIWRHRRRARMGSEAQGPARSIAAPQDMVACAVCGLHLPRSDALSTRGQYFCCAEHREAQGPH
jgi:uncharacterized protein